ncbi:MAG TPA: tRNA (N6-isopentenyl adenosine(37)-C2)-methylthiotransferase MiaB [Dehalococcoidales bacterium]|nr:tRNA (N6-isopentenyl adenosine(37)-C2)-methylthiotransferase MiaB [Dehalococcoidales bacterium]
MNETPKRYHIWTIGCQMNKAESDRLASLFEKHGMQSTGTVNNADLIVLNTCVVRKHAEDKATNKIAILKALKKANPQVKIAVTGCSVDSDVTRLKKAYPHVDYFFKAGECPPWENREEWAQSLPENPPVTAYVPIIQGCNNFCAYCIVPYRRGREKSRPFDDIVCEVRELVRRGVREVTLLGQNVDSYGRDLPEKRQLADLLYELNDIDGLWRIRFLTNHPKDMSERLIEAIASCDKVCEAINLPAQAGSDEILTLMRRGYTISEYRSLIANIRRHISGIALSNDIIVGFPTETEEQFEQTVKLLIELRFDAVHAAAYSPREGTLAAREMQDDISATEKKRRLTLIEQLQEKIATEINADLLDKELEILVEGKQKGKWFGRTRTDKPVFFEANENWYGKLATIRIDRTSPWSLQGTVAK